MDPVIRKLLTPGPAEIIRASQKDTEFIYKLNEQLEHVSRSIFGQRSSHKWQQQGSLLKMAQAVYYSLTNLTGNQTLGEEYCGILQVDQEASHTPGKVTLASMVILATFGNSTLKYVTNLFEQYLSRMEAVSPSPPLMSSSSPSSSKGQIGRSVSVILGNRKDNVLEILRFFKHFLSFFGQLHLTLFYVQGTFYHFSKRLLGIHYLLVRQSFANHDSSSRQTLKYLMVISILNSFLTCVNDSVAFIKSRKSTSQEMDYTRINDGSGDEKHKTPSEEVDPTRRCTLCLDKRENSSVTPCGHLFCWECIIDWLRSKQECPVCREQFPPSRVVPLQNYD